VRVRLRVIVRVHAPRALTCTLACVRCEACVFSFLVVSTLAYVRSPSACALLNAVYIRGGWASDMGVRSRYRLRGGRAHQAAMSDVSSPEGGAQRLATAATPATTMTLMAPCSAQPRRRRLSGPARATLPTPSTSPHPTVPGGAKLGANARIPAAPPQPCEQRGASRFNADWVRSLHEEIQEEILREGICACMWGRLLDKWSEYIKDVPYERVEVACAKQILQYARLTSASASPMFYETLRRLGKDVLVLPENVDENLLERLKPKASDSKWYRGFFGDKDKWTIEHLTQHLKTLHGSSDIKTDKSLEKKIGFIVTHVRSNRYSAVEMQGIVKVGRSVFFWVQA
jgi:hypothetical protein